MDSEAREGLLKKVGEAVLANVQILVETMDKAGLTTEEACVVSGTTLMVLMMKLLRESSMEAKKHEVDCFCIALREMILTDGGSETRQ